MTPLKLTDTELDIVMRAASKAWMSSGHARSFLAGPQKVLAGARLD
jgi:hypothetical protein